MASGIRLSDRLNTVSPSYAGEITRPSNPATGFVGGEGLEQDLQQAAAAGRLQGILNGCSYSAVPPQKTSWADLQSGLLQQERSIGGKDPARHWLKSQNRPRHLLTSVGRLVSQKVALMLQPVVDHATALEAVLQQLGPESLVILLGSGDAALQQQLSGIAEQQANFLFLPTYAEALSNDLYSGGDLFLMPSSFEPCGISQMLAMRAGQPCVVHGVGGLRDTIESGKTGFVFQGDTVATQAAAFVDCVKQAIQLRERDAEAWRAICESAAAQRFSWERAARAYIDELYTNGG
jgi:starch synthase